MEGYDQNVLGGLWKKWFSKMMELGLWKQTPWVRTLALSFRGLVSQDSLARKNGKFTMRKPWRHHLGPVTNVHSSESGACQYHVTPDHITEDRAQNAEPESVPYKNVRQTDPNWEMFYNITGLYSAKVSRSWDHESQRKQSNCFQTTRNLQGRTTESSVDSWSGEVLFLRR